MRSIVKVWREILGNLQRIVRLARYEQTAANNGTVLGRLWNFLNPVLQICVYWFVFSVGLKMRSVDGIPYAVWMAVGMIAWHTVSGAMLASAGCVKQSASIVHSLAIPLAIIPVKTVVSKLFEHLWMVVFVVFMALVNGMMPNFYWLQMLYYFFAMIIFLIAFALFASSIGTVVQDFGLILSPIIRLMFYLSYAVINLSGLSPKIQTLLKLNPVTYITMGYRYSLLYRVGFWETPWHTLSFWSITLLLMLLGCVLHTRMRERFVDLI